MRVAWLIVCLGACSSSVTSHEGPDAGLVDAGRGDGGPRDEGHVDAGAPSPDAGPAPDGGGASASSFVFVGCNRLQRADWSTKKNPSSANLAQLQQTFTDVAALPVQPQHFFFTGDLVLGLDTGSSPLDAELAAWAQLYAASPVAQVPLLALPGNHEMLEKNSAGNEVVNPSADAVWSSFITTNGFGPAVANGPTTAAPNDDALVDDQSRLSSSFDSGDTHFVLLNTDTANTGGAARIGWVPLHWLERDLAAAQADPAIARIFVLGHKPLVAPSGSTGSDATVEASLATPLITLLDATPKVQGYLCAHAHLWDLTRLPGTRGVAQVVAGNGGSQLESAWAQGTPFYGFTEVRVHADGRVGVVSWQRPVPSPYDSTSVSAATAAAEVFITP